MNGFLIAQIISILTIVLTTIGLTKKEKYKTLIYFTLCNFTMMATYFFLNRYLSIILLGLATIRTIVYFILTIKNIKPNVFVFVFFEITIVIITIILLTDYIDLLMLINLCLVTYTTWQDDMKILRLGYIISAILLLSYDIIVGAYIGAISELVLLVSSITTFIHYNVKNRIDNIVLSFYMALSKMYDIKIEKKNNYYNIFSDSISDSYNNFVLLENPSDLKKLKNKIYKSFQKRNLQPATYLLTKDNENINYIVDNVNKNKLLFHDVWMKLRSGYNPNSKKCLLGNLEFKRCDHTNKDEIIKVFDKGFVHQIGTGIYKYSQSYINVYEKKINDVYINSKELTPYMAYYNKKPICLVMAYKNGSNVFLCQITTLYKYRKKGVSSALIKFVISSERKLGSEEFYLVTEKYTWLEAFYMKNDFQPIAEGFCIELEKSKKSSGLKKTNT